MSGQMSRDNDFDARLRRIEASMVTLKLMTMGVLFLTAVALMKALSS